MMKMWVSLKNVLMFDNFVIYLYFCASVSMDSVCQFCAALSFQVHSCEDREREHRGSEGEGEKIALNNWVFQPTQPPGMLLKMDFGRDSPQQRAPVD